jgi:hypothetical protein
MAAEPQPGRLQRWLMPKLACRRPAYSLAADRVECHGYDAGPWPRSCSQSAAVTLPADKPRRRLTGKAVTESNLSLGAPAPVAAVRYAGRVGSVMAEHRADMVDLSAVTRLVPESGGQPGWQTSRTVATGTWPRSFTCASSRSPSPTTSYACRTMRDSA